MPHELSLAGKPLTMGLLPDGYACVAAAANGDVAALSKLANVALADAPRIGSSHALVGAEALAFLAAINGGERERRALAKLLEDQAALDWAAFGVTVPSVFRTNCLWQAVSIFEAIGDRAEADRVREHLANFADATAA